MSVTFARAAAPRAGAKPGGGGVVGAVINAVVGAGDGGCGNGTVNGKRGFQPGNKCAHGRNPTVTAHQKAHTQARAVAAKHARAGTLNTPEGRAALKTAATAARTLQEARATHKAAQKVKHAEAAKVRRVAARTAAATPEAQAASQLKAAHAAANPKKAAATPTPKPKPVASPAAVKPAAAPKPTAAEHVAAGAKEASDIKAKMAATHLGDLHAGVKAGAFDEKTAHKHLDKLARGHTRDELFAAAKHAGIEHAATTKKALVEHLKATHASAAKPAETAKAPEKKVEAPKPAPKPAEKKAEPAKTPASTPARHVERLHEAYAKAKGRHEGDTGPSPIKTLAEVRKQLGGTRAEQDAAIQEGIRAKEFALESYSGYTRRLTPEEVAGQFHTSGQDWTFLRARPGGATQGSKATHTAAAKPAETPKAPEKKAEAPKPADKKAEPPRAAEKSKAPEKKAEPAKVVEKPKAEPAKAAKPGASPAVTTQSFKDALREAHQGKIDDRQTTPAEVARKLGVDPSHVEQVVRDLGAKGAISYDHATPQQISNAKGYHTFPVDHEGKPYVGFRVDRPRRFEEATAGPAKSAAAHEERFHQDFARTSDPAARGKMVSDYVNSRIAGTTPVEVRTHGGGRAESFHSFEHAGVRVHVPAGAKVDPDHPAAQFVRAHAERPFGEVTRDTKNVYFSDHASNMDAEFAKRFDKANFRSAATASGADIVVHGRPKTPTREVIAHESGHNIAKTLYGSVTPREGSDFHRAANSGEAAPSTYAARHPAEDFAESVKYYHATPSHFAANFPRRHAVIKRILEDRSYGG